MEEQDKSLQDQIEAALEDREIPLIYFNGFINTIGTGDVLLILKRGDNPIAILNTSHIVAKTLAEKLGGSIAIFEEELNTEFPTTEELKMRMEERAKKDAS